MFSKKSDVKFDLSFNEAMELLFSNDGSGGFIQSENFKNGLYLDASSGTVFMHAIQVQDGVYDGVERIGNYPLTKSQFNSKFRVFSVAHLAFIANE